MSSDMWIIACEVAVRQAESGDPPDLVTGDTLPVVVAVFVSLSWRQYHGGIIARQEEPLHFDEHHGLMREAPDPSMIHGGAVSYGQPVWEMELELD